MSVFDPLLEDVVEAAMGDWAEDVRLVEVSRTFDPVTGETAAAEVRRTVRAIVSEAKHARRPATAGADLSRQPSVLVRTADVGGGRLRVEFGGHKYDVIGRSVRPGGVTSLMLSRSGVAS